MDPLVPTAYSQRVLSNRDADSIAQVMIDVVGFVLSLGFLVCVVAILTTEARRRFRDLRRIRQTQAPDPTQPPEAGRPES